MSYLRCVIENSIAVITLSNPPQNRITHEMISELADALSSVLTSGARALILNADGPDFCLGGDIRPWPSMDEHTMRQLLDRHLEVFNQFERLPIPTIAVVQGLCFGGGLEIALRADLIFAGETARFGHPEQSIAIITVLGGIYRMAERVGKARAMEWALTSEQVPAVELERHGVINKIFRDDELADKAKSFATRIAAGPTLAHAAHKSLLRIWAAGGVPAADAAVIDMAIPLFSTSDVKNAIPAAVDAVNAGVARPVFLFEGR